MTNQEAIKTLKEADTCFCKHGAFKDCHSRCKYKDALDMAIRALEQELCEDAISRQAVNTLIDELARVISDERCCITTRGRSTATIMQDILDLSSVKQEPKTGH